MAIDTIKSSAITDGTISTGDIADDAITGVKLANDINIAGDLTVTGNDINTAGSMLLRPGGAEKVRILSGGGITFNGDTSSANALDDYEEGNWTPNLIGSTSNPSTAVTGSGTYSKIGRLIYANYSFSNNDVAGASGGIRVNGLPFANAGGHISGDVMIYYRKSIFSDSTNISPYYASNVLYFYQTRNGSGEPWSEILFDVSGGSTGFYLWGSIVYETAT